MILLSVYLAIAIFFSFLCSILEAVILSVTPAYIQGKIQEGKDTGKRLKGLKKEIHKPLSAILTLNTFAHTIGAAGVGAEAQRIWGEEWLTVISAVLTLIILIFSEIIPKTLGASYWRQLAPLSAHLLRWMILGLYPFVWASELLNDVLTKGKEKNMLRRADFSAMAEIGIQEGILDQKESTILQNLFRFKQVRVEDIMTPRTVVISAEAQTSIASFYKANKNLNVSRIPIYEKKIDHITGFILKTKVLEALIEHKGDEPLASIQRKITMLDEDLPIPEAFDQLMKNREHIALVVDEFGGMAGIVTMEDILETLLGMEIVDEYDKVEDLRVRARNIWKDRTKQLETSENGGEG